MEKEIGNYMLKGWTLLGDSCAYGCNVPLLWHKNSGEFICVSCRKSDPRNLLNDDTSHLNVEPAKDEQENKSSASNDILQNLWKKLSTLSREIESSEDAHKVSLAIDMTQSLIKIIKELKNM
jgi:uncharacterized Zn finger protein (UPF0148 family)